MKGAMLVTGGAGFIGSHAAEHFARAGYRVTVLDNLSRARLMGKKDPNAGYNWKHLGKVRGVRLVEGDVRDATLVRRLARNADAILHAAAQTAVTTSVTSPRTDFDNNVVGAFNVLEAARTSPSKPAVVYCSTNKVYGENVNAVKLRTGKLRYAFRAPYTSGIPESFPIDHCEHTPYGCSKLTGDLYMQDYARLYGLRVGVFRMSCIYGTRQFGVEDQGWLAWFTIAALARKPLTIFGDGKQVRDVLFVTDLIRAYEAFLHSKPPHGVFNMGGGPSNSLSLLELLSHLEHRIGRKVPYARADWRPSDQKVYISDIRKARSVLRWEPRVTPAEGVDRLYDWVEENRSLFR